MLNPNDDVPYMCIIYDCTSHNILMKALRKSEQSKQLEIFTVLNNKAHLLY
jgi:hypothetical protein